MRPLSGEAVTKNVPSFLLLVKASRDDGLTGCNIWRITVNTVVFVMRVDAFYVHHSLHRESIPKKNSNKMTLLYSNLLIPVSRSTCFGRNSHPSSGARLNCIYSIWCL
jgi:hypothetical protein